MNTIRLSLQNNLINPDQMASLCGLEKINLPFFMGGQGLLTEVDLPPPMGWQCRLMTGGLSGYDCAVGA